jgi:2'-hydroxyisoflavone reductase
LKILILGGTVFLGRHIVNDALARGHQVTLFNRGQSNPHLFPQVEKIQGDRASDLELLAGREWDAVVDPSGYVPRVVSASTRFLDQQVKQYCFISSISAYGDFSAQDPDEDAPLASLADESTEEVNGETYGGLKALCERAVMSTMPERALVIRPGLIVGPHDPTDRFSYWPLRFAVGGEVLAPGPPSSPVQLIDVRDLSSWILNMLEGQETGVYNAAGPASPLTMKDFMEACMNRVGRQANCVWVDESFLQAQRVAAFLEIPCWVPSEFAGMQRAGIERALAKGLAFRSLAETIQDTFDWRKFDLIGKPLKAGLPPNRDVELLGAWKAAGAGSD